MKDQLWELAFRWFVVAIAALNLILDFDMMEQGAAAGAPKVYGMVWRFWLNGNHCLACTSKSFAFYLN
jgi:uncharacterized YccA/Bax inhibitor family protein